MHSTTLSSCDKHHRQSNKPHNSFVIRTYKITCQVHMSYWQGVFFFCLLHLSIYTTRQRHSFIIHGIRIEAQNNGSALVTTYSHSPYWLFFNIPYHARFHHEVGKYEAHLIVTQPSQWECGVQLALIIDAMTLELCKL